MKAGHTLVQIKGKGRGRGDLIQGLFTRTRSITDHKHDHIQKPESVTVTCVVGPEW